MNGPIEPVYGPRNAATLVWRTVHERP